MSALPFIANSDRLLVVVGPSGAGKDTVLRAWRDRLGGARVRFAQRVISRVPDEHEDHESVSTKRFQQLVGSGQLSTWWQANALSYGVRWRELEAISDNVWVVMNGSRAHLPALRAQAPGLRAVEISASAQVLRQRLAARGREEEQAIRQRLERRVPASVDLTVNNDGPVEAAVAALHFWWCSVHRESGV